MAAGARRTFLMGLAAGAGAAIREVKADVLVVGGGTAGAVAAIQAARLGARTVVVEAGPMLGGTTTAAGVDYPGLFHAWGRQVIAGIGWDLVKAAVELGGGVLPDFSVPPGRQHWRHQVRMSGGLYAALAEEACLKAGVELRYYETPVAARREGGVWRLEVVGKGTRVEVAARQVVDATGNAAVVGLMGYERLREAETQPGTLMYRLGGYFVEDLNFAELEKAGRAAMAEGRLKSGDYLGSFEGYLTARGSNQMHIAGADSSTSELHTATNARGRASLLRMMRFLRSQPGFEKLRLEAVAAEAGVRETYRVRGEKVVTVEDYRSGRRFEDAVAYSFYPIDLHVEGGVKPEPLQEGVVATIPLGALVPKGSEGVVVAGRCVSSDRLANSALRVQASSMAMGQAAGAAAALAVEHGVGVGRVPMGVLRKALRGSGGIVPE